MRDGFDILDETPTRSSGKNKTTCFTSKYQKSRIKQKVVSVIPVSPTRKREVEIIETLANSPTTSQVLRKSGRILSKEYVEKNKVNNIIVDNLNNRFKNFKI